MTTPTKAPTVRVGRRYRAERLDGPYDAIVIGSGISGLTTAALLSELGRKVIVLEQHYTAGGFTHSYERNGYEWDVGLHYIGEMDTPEMPRRFMDFLTSGKVNWVRMAANYDRFHIGEKVFDAVAGEKAFRENLLSRFPKEGPAIDRYLSLLAKVKRGAPLIFARRQMKPWLRTVLSPLFRWMLPPRLMRTTTEVMNDLTSNQELIAVLTAQWGDLGLPPGDSAFLMHALVAGHYMNGGFYPEGGSWRIAEHIIEKIRAGGGEVFTYARVQQILVEDGKTRGVLMRDGTRIDCEHVISSAGVFNTFQHLLPAEVASASGYTDQLKQVKNGAAFICVYLGLKGTAQELGLPKTNYWIFPSGDYQGNTQRFLEDQNAPFPLVYISFPSAKDPDFELRHPGRSTIEIVAPSVYEWFAQWDGTTWGKRGEDYEQLKAEFGERLLAHLYEKLPQLKGKVDFHEVSTPLSTNWFGSYTRGELCGLDHDPKRFTQEWLTPRTRIPGLWLTGQDVMMVGVIGAMMGGVLTAIDMAGFRKMLPILKRITQGPVA